MLKSSRSAIFDFFFKKNVLLFSIGDNDYKHNLLSLVGV